jgi:CheY-like chemotaxis protein
MLLCHEEVALSSLPMPKFHDGGGVLVVEDDADYRAIVCDVLADAGYEVRSAADGREALERVTEGMPELILTDLRMPHMDGVEFIAAFRQSHGAACAIVLISGEVGPAFAEEIGADGYLQKPVALIDLLSVVARYVGPAVEVPVERACN